MREKKKPKCRVCRDTKKIEVLVIGTDTEYVECPYCSEKPEYEKFQNWISKPVN